MSNLKDALHIPDTQSARDERRLAIQRVGIKACAIRSSCGSARRCAPTVATGISYVAPAAPSRRARTCRASSRASMRSSASPLECVPACCVELAMLQRLECRATGRIELRFPFFVRKTAPVSGVESLLDYQGRADRRDRTSGETTVWVEVAVPVRVAVPVLEGDLRLRRAQPALARHDPRRAARGASAGRGARALRRGRGVERAVGDAQARRREVRHRARLRQPEVRRGHGARRGAAPECRPARRPLRVDVENFESIHAHWRWRASSVAERVARPASEARVAPGAYLSTAQRLRGREAEQRRVAAALAHQHRLVAAQVDHGGRLHRAGARVDDRLHAF